jgi:flagellar hook assembly protein FlgD
VFNKAAPSGTLTVRWDGRDTKGRLVRSGSYEVRATSSGTLGPVELRRSFRVRRLAH